MSEWPTRGVVISLLTWFFIEHILNGFDIFIYYVAFIRLTW